MPSATQRRIVSSETPNSRPTWLDLMNSPSITASVARNANAVNPTTDIYNFCPVMAWSAHKILTHGQGAAELTAEDWNAVIRALPDPGRRGKRQASKVGRPGGRTLKIEDIETAVREVDEMLDRDKLPTREQVAEHLRVSPKTISRVVRDSDCSDFRRWTRQLLA